MKVKNIKIAIKSDKELFNEIKEVWNKLEKGEKVKKHEGISFANLDVMRKVLTEERLRILKVIKKEHPSSIYALAKILERAIYDARQFILKNWIIALKNFKLMKQGKEKITPLV